MSRPALLFVCLGNICRSPLAEAAFRAASEKAGLNAICDSAGTASYHSNSPPDPRSVRKAAEHGIDISCYRARQVEPADYTRFAHILAMDHQNLAELQSRAPQGTTATIMLLMDAVPGREGSAIADPYYDGEDQFEETWADVSQAARELVAYMQDLTR